MGEVPQTGPELICPHRARHCDKEHWEPIISGRLEAVLYCRAVSSVPIY